MVKSRAVAELAQDKANASSISLATIGVSMTMTTLADSSCIRSSAACSLTKRCGACSQRLRLTHTYNQGC